MHAVMRAASDYKAHFPITRNGIDFDCLFLVDATPYEFVLAAIGHPDVALLLKVSPDYRVTPAFGDDYTPLARLFNTGAGTFRPFNAARFLEEINRVIPGHYRRPTSATINRTYRHHGEDPDKPYFIGWRDNDLQDKRVSPENLAKTERCFGPAIRKLCQRTNQSSCWTHIAGREKPFFAPLPKSQK